MHPSNGSLPQLAIPFTYAPHMMAELTRLHQYFWFACWPMNQPVNQWWRCSHGSLIFTSRNTTKVTSTSEILEMNIPSWKAFQMCSAVMVLTSNTTVIMNRNSCHGQRHMMSYVEMLYLVKSTVASTDQNTNPHTHGTMNARRSTPGRSKYLTIHECEQRETAA